MSIIANFLRPHKIQIALSVILLEYSLNFSALVWVKNVTQQVTQQRSVILHKIRSQTALNSLAKVPVQLVVADEPCAVVNRYLHSSHHIVSDIDHHQINIKNIIRANIAPQCIDAQSLSIIDNRCGLDLVNSVNFSEFKFIKVSDRSLISSYQNEYQSHSNLAINRNRIIKFIYMLQNKR
jgi:hypothetical protein